MNFKNNILCVINDPEVNENLLSPAIEFARLTNAHINFLRIFDSYKSVSSFFNISLPEMQYALQVSLKKSLSTIAPDFSDADYSCNVREGIWFIEAIQEAAANQSKLILIAEPTSCPPNFNSNAMHIIRKSSTPVWLLRKNMQLVGKKILVVVDIDINDVHKKNANVKCMALANQLRHASTAQSELLIAHCWNLPNQHYLSELSTKITAHQINEMTKRQRLFHEEWFQAFCEKHHDLQLSHAYFIKGEPEVEIPALVADEQIDTLVMNTVNDINTAGLYISSSAETILQSIRSCSLITVKPDGFESPVKSVSNIKLEKDTI